MGRETTRRKEKRAAAYAVLTGATSRRPLTPDEARGLFRAIDSKDASGFGIRSLGGVDLNALHEAPTCIAWERRVTLIHYAAWRRRDHLITALLRAGADPGVREERSAFAEQTLGSAGRPGAGRPQALDLDVHGNAADEGPDEDENLATCPAGAVKASHAEASAARSFTTSLRPPVAAWVVRAVVRLRHAGAKVSDEVCQSESKGEPSAACAECGAADVRQPLAWLPCKHMCCEPCLWLRAGRLGSTLGAELRCPSCDACVQDVAAAPCGEKAGRPPPGEESADAGARGDWDCGNCSYTNFARRAECRNCGTRRAAGPAGGAAGAGGGAPPGPGAPPPAARAVSPGGASPEERGEASRRAWAALPLELEPRGGQRAERFRALGPRAAAAANLGRTRSERTAELLRAASAGDALRLCAVLDAGADVDARNEYGQTAALLAAQHGHAEAVRALLEVRADAALAANGGSTPALTATAQGHAAVLQALRDGGVEVHTATSSRSAAHTELPRRSGPATLTELIDARKPHPGAGSCYVDGAFTEEFLQRLDSLSSSLPMAERTKESPNDRSYFCDSEGWVQREFTEAMERVGLPPAPVDTAMAQMRFLHYLEEGGGLPPHVDLARTDLAGRRSTHTFILYLTDCSAGGQTVLLERMEDAQDGVLAAVEPRRGRLLVFPHQCPHLARPTVEVPKSLLRGEMFCLHKGLSAGSAETSAAAAAFK